MNNFFDNDLGIGGVNMTFDIDNPSSATIPDDLQSLDDMDR